MITRVCDTPTYLLTTLGCNLHNKYGLPNPSIIINSMYFIHVLMTEFVITSATTTTTAAALLQGALNNQLNISTTTHRGGE